MSDTLEKLQAKTQREARKADDAVARPRAAENRLKKAQKDRRHVMAIKLGYAMLEEMDEKPGIRSVVRDVLERRLELDSERSLFDLKPAGDGKGIKSDSQKVKLVKDDAA
jgi:hypothetical protein